MAGMHEAPRKKNKAWLWIAGACVAAAVAVLLYLFLVKPFSTVPTLIVETPQKLSAVPNTEFTLDVTVTDLGKALYPAMSMSIRFDSSRLEFLGVEEGNLFVFSDSNHTGRQLPNWECNTENSNSTGLINIMYLDTTGGRNAFSRDLMEDGENVVLRLRFRLRGSVRVGDVLDLTVEDAVFAASDESRSLAMTTNTLRTRNGRLVIGES